MPTKPAPEEFVKKIKAKMNVENLSVRELAKILGVTHPTVTELVTHGNRPSLETCIALSKWLRQSDVSILREAGLLPPGPDNSISFEDWEYLLAQLNPDERDELRQIAIMKIDRRQQAEQAERAANFKLEKVKK